MKITAIAALSTALLAAPAFADGHASGDAAAGESVYKKCRSCHMIVSDDGDTIQKGGKTGPNLYGIQRVKGSADFKYSKGLASVAESGEEWTEESFTSFVSDPSKYLTEVTGSKQRSKMTYKLKKAEDAANVWAYLVSVGPDAGS